MKEKFNKYFYFLFINIFAFTNSVFAEEAKEAFTEKETTEPLLDIGKTCSDLPKEIIDDINLIWSYMIVAGPIIFIISAFMDIMKMVSMSDEKIIPVTIKRIVKKFVALIILLILPKLITFIIGLLNPGLGTCIN